MPQATPKLRRVHAWHVAVVWPKVEPWIADALRRSNSDFSPADIRGKLDRGEAHLWIIFEGEPVAAGTTEFVVLADGRKLCVVSALAGEDMARWDHTWEQFEQHARAAGCHSIQIVGRQGWVRYMKARGFKQPWVVLEKQL